MLKPIFAALAFCAAGAQAIGLQHAVFRSQSTQGPAWQGTAEISKENCRITVYADYLDVELEWEFTVGGTRPERYGEALEIVGNLNLAENSSVIGMLVWYQDKILKAKLKSGASARWEYEQVVERASDAPPPPRDPVLLEWIRQDNYDISIFPVAWGSSRKVRFRYLVPIQAGKAVYPYAFSPQAKATLTAGPGTKGFQMAFSDASKLNIADHAELAAPEYGLQAYGGMGGLNPVSISPFLARDVLSSFLLVGNFSGNSFAGEMAHAYLIPPPAVLARIAKDSTANWSLQAVLRSGEDSCTVAYPMGYGRVQPFADIRVYGKQPIRRSIAWRLTRAGDPAIGVEEVPVIIDAEDGMQIARAAATGPFYPLAPAMPASLGAALGLIDAKYSLVALESDALASALADRYALRGVPTLEPGEIKADPGEDFSVPVDRWIALRGQSRDRLATPYYVSAFGTTTSLRPGNGLPEGVRLEVRGDRMYLGLPPELLRDARDLRIAVCDVRGTVLKSWNGAECRSGALSWSPSEAHRAPGVYLLRIWTAGGAFTVRFAIP